MRLSKMNKNTINARNRDMMVMIHWRDFLIKNFLRAIRYIVQTKNDN